MLTMAPEIAGARQVIQAATEHQVVVSAGHTQASQAELQQAAQVGVTHVTHLCNAMRPFLHRESGPIGAVIENFRLTADLIADGIHVTAPMLKARTIGTDRLSLITDAIRAADMGDGEYDLAGLKVQVVDGACRLGNGTLAGSVLTMAEAVKRIQDLAGVPPWQALQMASRNPAQRLGLTSKGCLEATFDADLVALDASFGVIWTMVGGKMVYQRGRDYGTTVYL